MFCGERRPELVQKEIIRIQVCTFSNRLAQFQQLRSVLAGCAVASREDKRRPITTFGPVLERVDELVGYWYLPLLPVLRTKAMLPLGCDPHNAIFQIHIRPARIRHFFLTKACHQKELKEDFFFWSTGRKELF